MPSFHRSSTPSRFRWNRLVFLLLLGLTALLFWWALTSGGRNTITPLQAVYLYFTDETRYAQGYSEDAFYDIKVGDDEGHVRSLLGAPLRETPRQPWSGWLYAKNPDDDFSLNGNARRHQSTAVFRFDGAGNLTGFHGQNDGGTQGGGLGNTQFVTRLGDGQNHLGLSNDRLATLMGKSMKEIQALFGKPVSVYESRATNSLRYSDSPTSGNYRQRIIDIGPDGKVVRVRDDPYWD